MRLFSNPVDMIKEVERDLFEMGTRYQSETVQDQSVGNNPDFQTIELTGYAYMLTGFNHNDLFEMTRYTGKVSEDWLVTEIEERLYGVENGPNNPGNAWKCCPEAEAFWGPFIRNGVFSYSYAERWQSQLPYVIRELKQRPNTRQAILTMYDRHEDLMNWGGLDRVPCSISYQFFIREGKLVCIYNQRSCDFIKFFAADVFFTVELLKYVASSVGCKPGQFIHFLGSLHAFSGDLKGREIF